MDKNLSYFLIFLSFLISYHFYQKNEELNRLLSDQDEALRSSVEAIESQKKYIDYLNSYYRLNYNSPTSTKPFY